MQKNKRQGMVDVIRFVYGLDSPNVLSVMSEVPREKFAPFSFSERAYEDNPVDIGFGQTMSQPYTVAFMTHLLGLKGCEKVLEVGTGSGYQAAVLSKLASEVYTVEIIKELAQRAEKKLKKLGYLNVKVKRTSGEWGWEKHSPYDAILVTAGIEDEVPEALFNQLKKGGVLVAPVGTGRGKTMTRYQKKSDGSIKKKKCSDSRFAFVPFIRENGKEKRLR